MPVRGDFRALRLLAEKLNTIASNASKEAIRRDLSEAALREVSAGFQQQQGPSGKPWTENKVRKRPILRRTGRLASGFFAQRLGWGFVLRSNVLYARFHQQGTRSMRKRPVLPERSSLPLRWRAVFAAITTRWFRKGLRR